MPKKNSHLQQSLITGTGPLQEVSRLFDNIAYSLGELPDSQMGQTAPDVRQKDFFTTKYFKHDDNGTALPYLKSFKTSLSSVEGRLLGFLLDSGFHGNPCTVIGHSGVGKSTLIKYISHYLYYEEPILQTYFLPIYICLSSYLSELTAMHDAFQVKDFIKSKIYEACLPYAHNYLMGHPREVLTAANVNARDVWLLGRFDESMISSIEKHFQTYYNELTEEKQEKLLAYTRKYVSRFVRRTVVILDDLDKFGLDHHREFLSLADELIADEGLAVILGVRRSTYGYIDYRSLEKRDYKVEVSYSLETVKSVLLKRLEDSNKKVQMEFNIGPKSGGSLIASSGIVAKAFIGLFEHEGSINLLANLSNQDLDNLFAKFPIMSRAADRTDHIVNILAREVMKKGERALKTHHVLDLLLRNKAGTFESSDTMAKVGLINLFCNDARQMHPYENFARMQLLSFLYYPSQGKEIWVPASELYQWYSKVVSYDMQFSKVLSRSLWRMYTSHLIYGQSCKREYDTYDLITQMTDAKESLTISECGRYYLRGMVTNFNYLYFMKDDICWREEPAFPEARIRDRLWDRIDSTFIALHALAEIEVAMLTAISNLRKVSLGREEFLPGPFYGQYFSARKALPEYDTVYFTKAMYFAFLNQLNRLEIDPKEIKANENIKAVRNLMKEMDSDEEAFRI